MNKIVCSECNDFMDSLPANHIKLTVSSPPYGKLRKYNGFSFDFERTARNLYRITEDSGVLVWVVGDHTVNGSESGDSFKQALYFMSLGFKLHDTMLYAKLNFIPLSHNRYEQEFEYMFVFVKGKLKTFNPILEKCRTAGFKHNFTKKGSPVKEGALRRRNQDVVIADFKLHTNIFWYTTGSSRKNHPAVFPEQLAADHINTWSNIGDLVFDPFSGSGTTCAEAKRAGRRYLGCDISEEYVKESQEYIDAVENMYDIL